MDWMKSKIERLLEYKCDGRYNMYHVTNRNVVESIHQFQVYESMKKKYSNLIKDGIEVLDIQEKSNKIWICWFQGFDNAPDIVKACINSVRINFPNSEIIILTNENINNYISFPNYIEEKRKKGIIGAAHYSDLIRVELLCKYGGFWLDATVLCTSSKLYNEVINNTKLFVFQKMDLRRRDICPIVASNWLIYSCSNQKILLLTRKLLFEYWKEYDYTANYFIFHLFFALSCDRYKDHYNKIPFYNNHSPHTLQFELDRPFQKERWDQIVDISCFHKLNHHNDYSCYGNSFNKYIIDTYLK